MKLLITLLLLFTFSTSFSQWTRVEQLPATDIGSIYHKGNTIYAGGKNIIYISQDKGLTWDSTSTIPQFFLVSGIIVFKNELYAAAPNKGVVKSADGGITWQNISAGLAFTDVADFCEFRGDLYAATIGNATYKLNPVTATSWQFFGNGLSNQSSNLLAIEANSNAIIAGTSNNGIYDYLPANTTTWEERLLAGQLDPNEGAYDITTAHDTLFYSGRTGKYYISTNNGFTWNFIGDRLPSFATTIVNAKQALITSRRVLENGALNVRFYYIKKDALNLPFVNFSVVLNHFSYKIDIAGDKLWDASIHGLFFMSLSDLPGITAADDTAPIPLPVRFTSFTANCDEGKVVLRWKTAQEQNSDRFDIERSADGISWTVIGNKPAAGNSTIEKAYSFTDNARVQDNFYRIGEYDQDGRVQYTNITRSSCNVTEMFSVWPNPVTDVVHVNIVTGNSSAALIKLFDGKGALVKVQQAILLQGSNQFSVDMKTLAKGMYLFTIDYNNGRNKKTMQLIKQ